MKVGDKYSTKGEHKAIVTIGSISPTKIVTYFGKTTKLIRVPIEEFLGKFEKVEDGNK